MHRRCREELILNAFAANALDQTRLTTGIQHLVSDLCERSEEILTVVYSRTFALSGTYTRRMSDVLSS